MPLTLDPTPDIEKAAAAAGIDIEVRYEPDLLPPQRFLADHRGDSTFVRSRVLERRWIEMLAGTEIALGIPGDTPDGLRMLVEAAPNLRWVQGTAAGTGEQVARADLGEDQLSRVCFTSAAGIHAVPLAEFALFGLLAFAKDADRLVDLKARREWPARWPMRTLAGSHIVVLGFGGIGREVARLCLAFGAEVTAVRRRTDAALADAVRVVSLDALVDVLPTADSVVVTLPGTARTHHVLSRDAFDLLPPHAVVVNVGRGTCIDEQALADALDGGRLRGVVLDVVETEPLPRDSLLWGRPNVIISPHTAALSLTEDDRIVQLFTENLRRFAVGEPLRNVIDADAGY